jgi:hypothetical protein
VLPDVLLQTLAEGKLVEAGRTGLDETTISDVILLPSIGSPFSGSI